jgi:glyoxylase-like metal-dependent hydrolase (beta-lactamase superfamily II)
LSRVEAAPGHPEIGRLIAPNPGPMTLEGTNTYLFGSDPCLVIDPGPADESHIEAVQAAAAKRGGIGAVLLTHGDADHSDAVPALGAEPVEVSDGGTYGGLTAVATPGHAAEHFCFLHDGVCFSGDLILGRGSTIVAPGGGSLISYLDSLRRLQELELELICPGHGPWVTDPAAKIEEYIEHRMMRERRLVAALERGERSRAALLAEVWDDVPAELRPAAAMVMQAHLEKLALDGISVGDLTD